MSFDQEDEDRIHIVLVNDEEQYSLWLKDRRVPDGWREAGKEGNKVECMQFIDGVWTDMRPLSLRQSATADHNGDLPSNR